jgi:hypothetical protein
MQLWLLSLGITLISSVLLSSCANPASPNPTPEPLPSTLNQLGVVSLEASSLGVSASATFSKVPTALDIKVGNAFTTWIDTCAVTLESDVAPSFPGSVPIDATPLDAGDTLVVRNGSLPYLELTKDVSDPLISYTSSAEGELPVTPLTLNIPGKDFPAFSDKAFETIPAFELTTPTDTTAVTANTEFSWTGTSENAVIRLDVAQVEPKVSITCFAKDDGTFQFSETTQTEMTGKGFTKGQLLTSSSARIAGRYEVQGEAALLLLTAQKLKVF